MFATARLLALTLVLTLTLLPTAVSGVLIVPDERPNDWTCDASGLYVCAGANAGGDVDCGFVSPPNVAQCSWTFGQIMGGASPLGLPGEASFSWAHTLKVCLTDGALNPISCTESDGAGTDTCAWLPLAECVLSLGPNPGSSDTVALEVGQCLFVEVTASATAEAWTLTAGDPLATALHDATGSDAGTICKQNDGRV